MDSQFKRKWKAQLEDIPQRVAPWERHKLPPVFENLTDADVVAYLEQAKPLLRRGRWWYFLMGAVRAWRSVWSLFIGRFIVFIVLVAVHQIYASLYLEALQYRTASVGGGELTMQLSVAEQIFPWHLGAKTEELLDRYQRFVELRTQAQSMDLDVVWAITLEYPYPEEELRGVEDQLERLHPLALDLEEKARVLGWDLELSGPPYHPSKVAQVQKQVLQMHPKVLDLEERARKLGWDLEVVGPPYDIEEVAHIEEGLIESERLRGKANKLRREYEVELSFPYDLSQIQIHEMMPSVVIESGRFQMGCTSEQSDCFPDERPVHDVELTHSFYMMKGETTQGLWKRITDKKPSYFADCGDDCPVEEVSWLEVIEFSNLLNEQLGYERCYEMDGDDVVWVKGYECRGWRLPTEAEWEYAARGGESHLYSGSNDLKAVGWYASNSSSKTHPVCEKKENGYGLCDMSGNVFEWVWDWKSAYSSSKRVDPKGPDSESYRVFRGGAWNRSPVISRIAYRYYYEPSGRYINVGFRLCRTRF